MELNPIVLTIATLVSVIVGHRLVARAWWRGTLDSNRAAFLWSLLLPAAIVTLSLLRNRLDPLVVAIAFIMLAVQFVLLRYGLRWIANGVFN